jgi:hypothetical protein
MAATFGITVFGAASIAGIAVLVVAPIAGFGLRIAIRGFIRSHPHLRRPIDPAEDRKKAKPWIVSQVISALIVVPLMFTSHGKVNVVFATGVILWLALTCALRLVGFLASRVRRSP